MKELLWALFAVLLIAGALWQPAPTPVDPTVVVDPVVPGPHIDRVEKAWVIVVRESAEQRPEQAAMLDALRKGVLAMGHQVRIYDPHTDVVKANGYEAKAKAGFPALFVQSPDGKSILANESLKATADENLALVRKATGHE